MSKQMNKFYQYVNVLLSNGTHEFSYHIFLPCGETGLTEKDIQEFLIDCHDVRDDVSSDGLSSGMYWTCSDTSAGAFVTSRDGSTGEPPIYCAGGEFITLFELAPELFYEA